MKTIACKNLNNKERIESSSGAIFPLIAKHILHSGGCIYGVIFDDEFNVIHSKIDNENDLYKLYGSKYAISNINGIYKDLEKEVKNGRNVLFTGTPCQTFGLRYYLKEDYSNLYVIDCVCHGAPNNSLWREYLTSISNGRKPRKVNFRNKDNGWRNYNIKIEFDDESIYCRSHDSDIYLKAFIANLTLRPSCFVCKFKGLDNRYSDITVGDLWGAEDIVPDIYDDVGVSLVMIHSDKGLNLYKSIKHLLAEKEINIEDAIKYNPAMITCSEPNYYFEGFNNYYKRTGNLKKSLEKFVNPSIFTRLIYKMKKYSKRLLFHFSI